MGCNLFDAPEHEMMTSLQQEVAVDQAAQELGVFEILHRLPQALTAASAAGLLVRPCDPRSPSRHLVPEKAAEVRSVDSNT